MGRQRGQTMSETSQRQTDRDGERGVRGGIEGGNKVKQGRADPSILHSFPANSLLGGS